MSRKLREEDTPKKVVDVYQPPLELFHSPPGDVIGVALQILAGDRPAGACWRAKAAGTNSLWPEQPEVVPRRDAPRSAGRTTIRPPTSAADRLVRADILLRRTYDFPSEDLPRPAPGTGAAAARAERSTLCLHERSGAVPHQTHSGRCLTHGTDAADLRRGPREGRPAGASLPAAVFRRAARQRCAPGPGDEQAAASGSSSFSTDSAASSGTTSWLPCAFAAGPGDAPPQAHSSTSASG